ncbi:MAG: putative membrane protein YkoI, partial [Candidatus Krumholzibacteriia bacterium]
MKLNKFMFSTHQGVGLLVGIQVFLWISSGFVMSVVPIEKVRGEDWVSESKPVAVSTSVALLSPAEITSQANIENYTSASLKTWLGSPVYRINTNGDSHLFDAATGKLLSPITADQARAVAQQDYAGPGTIADVTLWDEEIIELRGRKLPIWRVDFDDSRNSTVYVSQETGDVATRRNKIWRIFDFFWMLHIMDYNNRDDFNHPLLITAAV